MDTDKPIENHIDTLNWHFNLNEAKMVLKLLHKSQPIDPSIYHFYNNLLSFLYERMTLDEVENLLQ